jgi:glycosyltransferase involved in cell wall biosynthesis
LSCKNRCPEISDRQPGTDFPDPLRLTLFMTRGMSLEAWERAGIIDRELALYRRYGMRNVEVAIVTYGGPREGVYADWLPGLTILYNRWRLPDSWYERLVPWLHASWLRHSHVVKTNQTNGGILALRAARLWRKPLLARCGYMYSEFRSREEGDDAPGVRAARAMESEIFGVAQRVAVTTKAMAEDVAERISDGAEKTIIVPNYVDTELFKPAPACEQGIDLLFVGRLTRQKNVAALLDAHARMGIAMTVVGDGPLRELVEQALPGLGNRLRWLDHALHRDLPNLMARTKIFILPSLWEGHPKALIEAMAAGMAVIGSDAPGIRELVKHGETGWLCGTGTEDIEQAVCHLMARPDLRNTLGVNARAYAVENLSLDHIADVELALLRDMATQGMGSS